MNRIKYFSLNTTENEKKKNFTNRVRMTLTQYWFQSQSQKIYTVFSFHLALITLEKLQIQLFSFQL